MTHAYLSEQRSSYLNEQVAHNSAAPAVRGILKLLSAEPDDLVLDFSSDTALYAMALGRFFTDAGGRGVIFSCDTSTSQLEALQQESETLGVVHHFYPVHLEHTMPFELPFQSEQLDAILTVDRLSPRPSTIRYLREFARILKPCGTLLLAQSRVKSTFATPGSVTKLPNSDDMSPYLRNAGFDILSPFTLKNYAWITRAMKPVVSFA